MPKKVLIALPPGLLEQVDFIAQTEHRNRSELIREALRRYLDNFKRTQGVQLQPMNMERPQMTSTPAPAPRSAPVPQVQQPQQQQVVNPNHAPSYNQQPVSAPVPPAPQPQQAPATTPSQNQPTSQPTRPSPMTTTTF